MKKAPSSTPFPDSTEPLVQLLQRLASRVPGYPYPLALITRLSGQLEKRMAEAANAALRPVGLSYVLYQAMMIIHGGENGTIAPSAIAQLTGERPNNVSHICNELESRNLILRRHEATDRRKVGISLTSAGHKLLKQAQPLVWALWRLRFAGFSEAELAILPLLVSRQIANLDACESAPE
jgi:MarR family transcriptional regulator, negative regulator of the multidrug operon emrRAB